MKKLFILLTFGLAGVSAMYFNMACTTKSPSAPNFQSPLQTIVAINPTLTATFTFTPTPSFTNTPVITPTPFATNTPWIGFKNPQGIAFYSGGLFVADTGNNQVRKFTVNGGHVANWGVRGIVEVNAPQAVAVDGTGNLYVVGGISGVGKYNVSGSPTTQFTSKTFTNPQGVAVDGSGNIYVSDTTNNAIVELSSAGVSMASLPITAVGAVTLVAPYGIAVNSSGTTVAVAASDNNIHLYSSIFSGTIITTIPGYPVSPPAFNFSVGVSMGGLAFDSSNNLYVADTGYHQIEEFAFNGLNSPPTNIFNGINALNSPTGVAVDGNGNIYVTDSINNNVVKFLP